MMKSSSSSSDDNSTTAKPKANPAVLFAHRHNVRSNSAAHGDQASSRIHTLTLTPTPGIHALTYTIRIHTPTHPPGIHLLRRKDRRNEPARR